ncbi:adenylate/guanylate cyclase domain-containing protein [Calothrix sp. 336/3]|uniref:adenylate/guanylate cyclase domain-containing protein n=1 Tax=Calothrix sp. 336/3 TaxID=1337936 RepID=UPI0004E4648E|nr:adenylate/guanylate cyclase domain-containing protein [Calothrix sp. 336/3]AKG21713.1 family 3 adenylate cyclase [Calothrix sp. 336/3]
MIDKKPKSATGRLTLLYIISLAAIGCLSALGQFLIQRSLTHQELNLKFVSIAQRQQMLSQQLGREAIALQMTMEPGRRQQQIRDIQNILKEWQVSRQDLQQLEKSPHLSADCRLLVTQILQQTSPGILQSAARTLITTSTNPRLAPTQKLSVPEVTQISATAKSFMQEMDSIISTYNQNAQTEVKNLRQLEIWLFVMTVFTLVCEGIWVFQPAVKKIHQTVNALGRSLAETQEIASKLAIAQEKSDHLLLNILPESIAERLKEKPTAIADGFGEVTVLFADIVGFTQLSTQMPPQKLVAMLNQIFSMFDHLAEKHGLEKIKTIGDAYMVVGGLPTPRADHAIAIVEMALDMQAAMAQFNQETQLNCNIRIGINSGPVVAGVIGIKKFIYDLWGDTVNIASRMESHGIPGSIQVSQSTSEQVQDKYILESRGVMQIKGKGEMETYLVKARKERSLK